MVRQLFALLLALVVGAVSISLLENAAHLLYPPPADFDFRDLGQLEELLKNLPFTAYILLILAHAIGSFLASWTAYKISRTDKMHHALLLGVMFTLGGISNLFALPYHPIWFAVLDSLVYLPLAYLGFRFSQRARTSFSQKDD